MEPKSHEVGRHSNLCLCIYINISHLYIHTYIHTHAYVHVHEYFTRICIYQNSSKADAHATYTAVSDDMLKVSAVITVKLLPVMLTVCRPRMLRKALVHTNVMPLLPIVLWPQGKRNHSYECVRLVQAHTISQLT